MVNRRRWLAVGVAAALLVSVVATAWGRGRAPYATPPGGLIAFSSFSGGEHHIDTVPADGGAVTQLASDTSNAPVWSPTGTELAFAADAPGGCSGCTDLYVMSADGTGRARLTDSGTSGNPAWSPTGKAIAFDRCDNVINGPCGIYSVSPTGGGLKLLGHLGLEDDGPVWSPTGRQIMFSDLSPQGIYVMSADGSGLRRLTRALDSTPVWSPDGQEIAFTRTTQAANRTSHDAVYVMRADGSHVHRLTPVALQTDSPEWSPNGKQLAFVGASTGSGGCDKQAIYTMAPAGGHVQRLTPTEPADAAPTWSPDSQQLAFTSTRSCLGTGTSEPIYVVSAMGGTPELVNREPGAEVGTALAWQPIDAVP